MIRLKDLPTGPPKGVNKLQLKEKTNQYAERIGALHQLLMAEGKHSLLIILQGMDASGKDGAIRNVFKECTHNGISVYSFKKPTKEEFAHDFLWRVHKQCPAKGEIKIFNRSHYEDVLIQRVHGWIDEETVNKRFDAINAFEKLLTFDANTVVLKFFLNISYNQQKLELEERIDERAKNWKHNPGDWKEREHWSEYMRCYEEVLNRSNIPWIITPVDRRWYRDYIMAKHIVKALETLNMEYPELSIA